MIKNKVIKLKSTPIKGEKKHGNLDLIYIVPYKVEIGIHELDTALNKVKVDKSAVIFRFHTDEFWASKSVEECTKQNGGVHVRCFIYNGIDKTEDELYEWAMQNNILATDGLRYDLECALESIQKPPSMLKVASDDLAKNKSETLKTTKTDPHWLIKLIRKLLKK